MSSFFNELKLRNVVRVAVLYLVFSWVLVQLSDILFPMFSIPEWGGRLVVIMLAMGFPLALIFAWVLELTPDGVKLEKNVDRSASATHTSARKLDLITIILLVVALVVLGARNLVNRNGKSAGQTGPAVGTAAAVGAWTSRGGSRRRGDDATGWISGERGGDGGATSSGNVGVRPATTWSCLGSARPCTVLASRRVRPAGGDGTKLGSTARTESNDNRTDGRSRRERRTQPRRTHRPHERRFFAVFLTFFSLSVFLAVADGYALRGMSVKRSR